MIEILTIVFLACGTLAAPRVTSVDREMPYSDNDAQTLISTLPGVRNLGEKSLPVSRLYATEPVELRGNENLAERSQIPESLPGTRNMAEKVIPDYVIFRMSQPSNQRVSSHPDFEQIPLQPEEIAKLATLPEL
ncbi:uncharacterized protein [Prorops nasuta]|uniref:uncharacterized protein n=1 Tax=Prorops nasuta TaxID=863751 RepID=UPI0034CF0027